MKKAQAATDPARESGTVATETAAWPTGSLPQALEAYGKVLFHLRRLRELRNGKGSASS